ncbi:lysophospholipid acyltransferase family protein [Desulfonatronospira sp.]|uniref:lysophospholipid acyltransferase family protein n=1 Tax=Desulfonatronospira sp. TaxID=1962951 RepID=UPI0025C63C15|nr:lysophospholipid acyltransferase family protein [Desulfonatronospira sp.]
MKSAKKTFGKFLKRLSYPLTAALFLVLGFFTRKMSRTQALRMARFLGYLACDVLRVRRRLVLNNLQKAFPEQPEEKIRRLARQSYFNQARNIIEILRIPLIQDEKDAQELIEIRADPSFHDTMVQNRGAVVVSGHLSSWEVIGVCAGKILTPLHIVVKPIKNSYLDRRINQLRTMHGNRIIYKDHAVRQGLQVLNSGGIIVILGDQSKKHGNFYTDFLGRKSSVVLGPAFLALKTGVPLFVETCRSLDNGRYQVDINQVTTSDLDYTREGIRTLTVRYTKMLERFIREHPEEWLWLHDRWKRKPPSK